MTAIIERLEPSEAQLVSVLGRTSPLVKLLIDAKLERVRALGASATINYAHSPEWNKDVAALTSGRGVSCVIEVVGVNGNAVGKCRKARGHFHVAADECAALARSAASLSTSDSF